MSEVAPLTSDHTPSWLDRPTANPMTHHVSEEASFPVKIQQLNVEIEDTDTDVMLCGYSDYVLVTVTQTDSFGTIFQCRYIRLHLL